MPFELIPRKAAKMRMDATKVHLRSRTMNLKKRAARGGGPTKYYIFAIGASVLKQMGWDDETRLSILWGTGSDRGQVQITPDLQGSWKPRVDKTGCGYLSTTALPADCALADFPDKPVEFSTQAVGAATKPRLLQITLPQGFYAARKVA